VTAGRGNLRVVGWPAAANRRDNPYNWLLYREMAGLGVDVVEFRPRLVIDGTCDVWHIHWPDALLNSPRRGHVARDVAGTLALLAMSRARGVAVVCTVHNLASHDRRYPRLERFFWSSFTSRVDGIISPSRAGLDAALRQWPRLERVPASVIPHGHYRALYPSPPDRAAARATLGVATDTVVISFAGQIRAYKDIPGLVRSFKELPDGRLRLVIAGRPETQTMERQVRAVAAGDDRISLHLSFATDEEVQTVVRAADLVVLPYREVLNSGSAILALSLDRPVLVPDLGAMAELSQETGPEWVRTYGGQITSSVLGSAIAWAQSFDRAPKAPLAPFDWPGIGAATLEAYRRALLQRRGP
jgi:beta-1,4-mannosyltransferase